MTSASVVDVPIEWYEIDISDQLACEHVAGAVDHRQYLIDRATQQVERAIGDRIMVGDPVSSRNPVQMSTRLSYPTAQVPTTITADEVRMAALYSGLAESGYLNYTVINSATINWTTTSTAATGANYYWVHANGGSTGPFTTGVYWSVVATPLVETPEMRAAAAARQAQLLVINKRADQLFLAHLSDLQRKMWAAKQYIEVVTGRGRHYRIKNYRSGNVFLLDAFGKEVRKYCAYANDPGGTLPDGDHWFAQLLALKFNERDFLAKANTWDLLHAGMFVGQGVDADAELPMAQAA